MAFINLVERVCPECGKVFVPAALHIYKDDTKFFCKWSCYNSYLNRKEKRKEEVKGMKSKVILVKLDEGAKMPTRAHEFDAGLDLYAPKTATVPGCKYTGPIHYCGYGMVGVGQHRQRHHQRNGCQSAEENEGTAAS